MPSDEGISPEDRERLAKSKFTEWFDELYAERFPKTFDSRVEEMMKAGGRAPAQGEQQSRQSHPSNTSGKRRSLMEICMSDLLGIG